MAVHDRSYRPYEGPLLGRVGRCQAIASAAASEIAESRLYVLAIAGCLLPPTVFALLIYLQHNVWAMMQLGVGAADLPPPGAELFAGFLATQSVAAYVLALLVGPGIVSGDLSDGALALYLCRPISRAEYVLGKSAMLVALLSALTWLPGLALLGLQAALSGTEWFAGHARIAPAILISSMVWVLLLTSMSLAVSAWVRRRTPARLLLLAAFCVPGAFGSAINESLATRWGSLASPVALLETVWRGLLGSRAGAPAMPPGPAGAGAPLPVWAAWLVLAALCAACLWLLQAKLRATMVVRS